LSLVNDPLLTAGAAAIVVNLLRGRRDFRLLAVAVAGGGPLLSAAISGGPFDPVVQLAIPFCLNIGLALSPLLERTPSALGASLTAAVVGLFVMEYAATGALQPEYAGRPAAAQREALAWIEAHIPADSLIAADWWAWPELQDPAPDGVAFERMRRRDLASPGVTEYTLIASDWTPARDVQMPRPLPSSAANGGLVKRWVADGTNVELRKAPRPGATEPLLLAGSAQYLVRRFERSGAFTALDGSVTSQSQASAMLRSAWMGDRDGFMRVWRWTAQNLLTADGLLASGWRNGTVTSADTTTDADADAALALLMASRRWTDEELLVAGRRLVSAIWRREVVLIDGRPYAGAGDWTRDSTILAISPGGFAPYAYEVFATVDPDHDWIGVVQSGYGVLSTAADLDPAFRSVGLPPDWLGVDRATGALTKLPLAGRDTMRYSEDAARTYWRVALHRRWTMDERADRFLRSARFLREEVAGRGAPARAYAPDGVRLDDYPSGAGNAAALAALLTLDPATAHDLYASHLVGTANRLGAGVFWGDLNDLHGQEWGWFATAFYADRLPDLWRSGAARSTAEATQ
jgi:endoglucanase